MSREFINCVTGSIIEPPGFLLSWTSGLMQFYPWLLRAGLMLRRVMQ
ncbi:MAG: hypothetical protein ABI857_00890 [Acidobacteriota bacterium]